MRTSTFDFIVVGGGTAGCTVAGRLAGGGARVAMLEAGPVDDSLLITVPGFVGFASSARRYNWNYETVPQRHLDGRRLPISTGRVLGGGSSINGMVYSRGFPEEYDAWRDLGCEGWGSADVLPWFRKAEGSARPTDALHGTDGPLRTSLGFSGQPISGLIMDAAEQAGFERASDFTTASGECFGYYDFTINNGRRCSAPRAYLDSEQVRRNLTIFTETHVRKVLIEGGRARGVEIERGGCAKTIHADGEIVLTTGALNTPSLMMHSGVGPADHLSALGIPVVLDQPLVGENLQNHLCFKLAYAVNKPITAFNLLNPFYAFREGLRYVFARKGFLAEGLAPVGGFLKSSPSLPVPDLQIFAPPAVNGLRGTGICARLPSLHGFTLFLSDGRPASRGTVRLASGDPKAMPLVDPGYLEDESDLERIANGIERTRQIASSPALQEVGASEILPGAATSSRQDILAAIRRGIGHQSHYSGTCAMGPSADKAVTDSRLRVFGVDGLRIADTSVMPLLMNGNTNAPVNMIAERAASFIASGDPPGTDPQLPHDGRRHRAAMPN